LKKQYSNDQEGGSLTNWKGDTGGLSWITEYPH